MDAMDTPIDAATQRRRKLRRLAPAIGVVVVAVAALALLTGWLQPSVKRDRIRTAFVEKGEMSSTLDASGLVVPEFEQTLTAPMATRVVRVSGESLPGPGGHGVRQGQPSIGDHTRGVKLAAGSDLARKCQTAGTLSGARHPLCRRQYDRHPDLRTGVRHGQHPVRAQRPAAGRYDDRG